VRNKVYRVVPKGRPYLMIPLGLGVCYSEKGGGLVLKHETSWTKISGFVVNTKKGCFWFYFRRTHL
jgi:hypothetical protein